MHRKKVVIVALSIALIGVVLLGLGRALSPFLSSEAETGTVAGPATAQPDSKASNGRYVQFGAGKPSVLFDSDTPGNFEIYRTVLGSGVSTQLTYDPTYDSWWARASPDGTKMLFYRTPKGIHDSDYTKTSLWMANIDGTNVHQVVANGAHGWNIQGHAEWSPDGTKLVMFESADGIVVADLNGTVQHTVTKGIDPVWSADGTKIIYINCATASDYPLCTQDTYRVYTVNVDGTSPRKFEDNGLNANDPTMSPDGSTVTWESGGGFTWTLYQANADGSNLHVLFDDQQINTNPIWITNDTLVFYKTKPGTYNGFGIWTINKDGTGAVWNPTGLSGIAEMPFPIL